MLEGNTIEAGSSISDARLLNRIENSVLAEIWALHPERESIGLGVGSVYSAHDGRWLVGLGVEFDISGPLAESHSSSLIRLMSF